MRNHSVAAIFVLSICFVFSVLCDDPLPQQTPFDEISYSKDEYNYIFKNIPVLFEYLLAALQTNPEAFETNNIKVFTDANIPQHKRVKKDIDDQLNLNHEVFDYNVNETYKADSNNDTNIEELEDSEPDQNDNGRIYLNDISSFVDFYNKDENTENQLDDDVFDEVKEEGKIDRDLFDDSEDNYVDNSWSRDMMMKYLKKQLERNVNEIGKA